MKKTLRTFLKKFAIVVVIFGVSFSNIPFYAFTSVLDGYVATLGVVDKAFHLAQDSDVVDNFTPIYRGKNLERFYKLAGEMKIEEAYAAVTFVGSASNSTSGNTDTTVSLTGIPLQNGDLVIVAGSIGDDDDIDHDVLINTAGYTEVADLFANDTDDTNVAVWYKFMGATPDTSVIVEGSTGGLDSSIAVTVMAFRGVDPTTPMDVAATTAVGGNTFNPNPPAITHNNPAGIITVIVGANSHVLGGTGTYTFPTGYTTNAIFRGHNDTNDTTVGMGYRNSGVSNPEDPGVMTHSGTLATTNSWAAVTMALRPYVPPAATLTISQTAGSKVATKNSGDVDQYAHDTACTGAATCAAFTLTAAGGTVNVTSIKVTENGTVTADNELSDVNLYYDFDGNWSDAGAETLFGTQGLFAPDQTATISGTLAISAGATAYIYVRYDLAAAVYPTGGATVNFQIASATNVISDGTESGTGTLGGTTTILPNVTSYSNSTEPALTNGGRETNTISISGVGFGTTCNVAGGNKVSIGAYDLSCTGATFSNTTITIPVDAAIPDSNNGGTGASGLLVTIGSAADDTRQTFYVYPTITSIVDDFGGSSDTAREYDAGDNAANNTTTDLKDGEIQIDGIHFGSSGAVYLGLTAIQAVVGTRCGGSAYTSTCITIQVPTVTDEIYTGSVIVDQLASGRMFSYPGFRILPRIISTGPVNLKGGRGDTGVSINGRHLCQDASCVGSPEGTEDITFNGVSGKTGSTWGHTSITTITVPATATDGPLVVTSDADGAGTFTSNSLTFDVKFAPTTPTGSSAGGSNNPTLSGTAFSDGTDGDTHLKAQWQIAHNADGDWTTPEWSRTSGSAETGTTVNTTNGTFANSDAGQTELDCGTTYKGRARYMDNANGGADAYAWEWSSWSANYTFSTAACNVAPTLTVSQPDGIGDTVNVGDLYNITYDLADPDNVVTAAMYYDADAVGLNGTAITGACATAAEGTGATCSWNTTGMTVGTYYVYGITNDGVNPAVNDYSSGIITINAPPQVTADASGTQTTPMDSGATGQYVGAVFRFQQSSGSADTITALTISETGTVNANANLSTNAGIRYESGVATCTYNGTETLVAGTFNVSEKMALSSLTIPVTVGANYTCVYVVFDVASGAVGGQTIELEITAASDFTLQNSTAKAGTYPVALSGTTTVRPNVTDVTDSPLADGGRNGETFTITGAGFGTACASVSVVVEGTALTCNSANNTTISATIPGTQITTYGGTGASGLLVTVGGTADDARQTYYVYPNVNSVITSVANAAREGENITLTNSTANASRFGATQGTVTFSGGFGSVSGSIVSWGDTSIQVTVPAAIGDTVYLGDITVTRNADSKTDLAYDSNGFRILPRITSNTQNNGVVGDIIKITGDHFCQGAGCPAAYVRSSATNNVKFDTTQAIDISAGNTDFVNAGGAPCSGNAQAWTDSEICVKVPAGISTGSRPTQITSSTYVSNAQAFTVNSSAPNNPNVSGSRQYKSDNATVISAGGTTNESTVILKADISASISINMAMQVEIKPTGTGFACGAGDCVAAVEGTVGDGGACTGCNSLTSAKITITGLSEGQKHWQARVRNTTTNEYSGWISFGTDPDSVFEIDFIVDTTPPVISGESADTSIANKATVTWNTNELATTQLEYGTDPALVGATFTAITDTPASTNGKTNGHSVELINLPCGAIYYYRARSKDSGNMEGISATIKTFTTSACPSKPAKTAIFHIVGATGSITGATAYPFSVTMPELATSTQSAFVELTGVYETSASSITIAVQHNSEPARTYALPGTASGTIRSHFKIIHKVTSVNYPASNTLTVTPALATVYISSAKITVTYAYTP